MDPLSAFLPKRISPLLVLSCFFTLFNLQGTRLFASFLCPQRTLISYHIQNRLSRGFFKFFQTFFNRLFFALAWNFDILPRFVPLVKWFFQLFSEVFQPLALRCPVELSYLTRFKTVCQVVFSNLFDFFRRLHQLFIWSFGILSGSVPFVKRFFEILLNLLLAQGLGAVPFEDRRLY